MPDVEVVRAVVAELSGEENRQISVLAVARHFGLSNTTFRRHFAGVVEEIKSVNCHEPDGRSDGTGSTKLRRDNERLRRENARLRSDVAASAAAVQRLALENHRLRSEVEALSGVVDIASRNRT